jgi:DDE superfamily endonuclease
LQLGVFLTYVSGKGRALIDRKLYLPTSWTTDRERCGEAGIGEEVDFATKPELARRVLERARDAGAVHGYCRICIRSRWWRLPRGICAIYAEFLDKNGTLRRTSRISCPKFGCSCRSDPGVDSDQGRV